MDRLIASYFVFASAILFFFGFSHTTQAHEEPSPAADFIYLKADNGIGYVRVKGEVLDASSEFVIFQAEGTEKVILYTREHIRLLELGKDDIALYKRVPNEWNLKHNPDKIEEILKSKDKEWPQMTVDVIREILPPTILLGIVLIIALYIVVSTVMQLYQRFVIESSVKRLNSTKLMHEIEKLKVEIYEMRSKLGLNTEHATTQSIADTSIEDFSVIPSSKTPQFVQKSKLLGSYFHDFHLFSFIKHSILGIASEETFNARVNRRVQIWKNQKKRHPIWLSIHYWVFWFIARIAVIFGGIMIFGLIGNIVLYIVDPSYRAIFSGYFIIFVLFGIALIISVVRLNQKLKERKYAYDELFNLNEEDTPRESD